MTIDFEIDVAVGCVIVMARRCHNASRFSGLVAAVATYLFGSQQVS